MYFFLLDHKQMKSCSYLGQQLYGSLVWKEKDDTANT